MTILEQVLDLETIDVKLLKSKADNRSYGIKELDFEKYTKLMVKHYGIYFGGLKGLLSQQLVLQGTANSCNVNTVVSF